jgi:hypothetical protein
MGKTWNERHSYESYRCIKVDQMFIAETNGCCNSGSSLKTRYNSSCLTDGLKRYLNRAI